jgi:hypothetical protein
MDDPDELRAKAAHYRELALYITDARARSGAIELSRQYERQAGELEAAQASGSPARMTGDSNGG